MKQTESERIQQVISYFCNSKADFARKMEEKPQTVSNWVARGAGGNVINKILRKFPSINAHWLITGEGSMLNENAEELMDIEENYKEKDSTTYVPLVNIDSVGGVHSLNSIDASEQYVERMIPLPDARPGDVAIMQSGNSMAPTIPAGAILQIRQVQGWREYFGYGSDFVLWLTDERRITKQVLKYEPDPKNYITCHSYNPEAADEELPKAMIKQVWKVVNVLINKGW